jgi:hypothetical protein
LLFQNASNYSAIVAEVLLAENFKTHFFKINNANFTELACPYKVINTLVSVMFVYCAGILGLGPRILGMMIRLLNLFTPTVLQRLTWSRFLSSGNFEILLDG